jgi:hypothetical protein
MLLTIVNRWIVIMWMIMTHSERWYAGWRMSDKLLTKSLIKNNPLMTQILIFLFWILSINWDMIWCRYSVWFWSEFLFIIFVWNSSFIFSLNTSILYQNEWSLICKSSILYQQEWSLIRNQITKLISLLIRT